MKPPASKRSNGSNRSGSKNNSLNTSSSSIKKRNGGASKVSFSAKEKGQKSKEGMDGDEWFLYHDPDRDLCAHKACQRPQQLSINWVQCDDCDSWYHSLCALGTNTELEGDADFHCGCTLKRSN
uniref:PHD-type domain-containing protein n=1 Tax=Ditylenchus dipsaci TaxID=166011 RepID=A0A915D7Q5_9BILA